MSKVSVDAIRILLVEDDQDDVLLAERALLKTNIWNQVDVVYDGKDALDYLYHEGRYSDSKKFPRPGLILLDLSLPRIDGREVLTRIAEDPTLRDIPIVIVSTSDYEKDIEFGRAKGVQNYIIKPIEPDNIIEAIGRMENFHVILGSVMK